MAQGIRISDVRYGVIVVDQQDQALRVRVCKMLEGQSLVVMRLDRRVSHRPIRPGSRTRPGRDRGCAAEVGDVAFPRRQYPGLGTVGPPQTEIDKGLARRTYGAARTIRAASML